MHKNAYPWSRIRYIVFIIPRILFCVKNLAPTLPTMQHVCTASWEFWACHFVRFNADCNQLNTPRLTLSYDGAWEDKMFGARNILSALGYRRNMAVRTTWKPCGQLAWIYFVWWICIRQYFAVFAMSMLDVKNSNVILNRTRLIFLSFSTATEGINRSWRAEQTWHVTTHYVCCHTVLYEEGHVILKTAWRRWLGLLPAQTNREMKLLHPPEISSNPPDCFGEDRTWELLWSL